jgi:DNA-binding PadR family transcriptional regulator
LTYFQISAHDARVPRRKPGSLLPIEVSILRACLEAGDAGSHGFAVAKAIAEAGDTRSLTATGTLYRALHRLAGAGLVESWWEDPDEAADAGRPRRRCYRITGAGAAALAVARAEDSNRHAVTRAQPGFAT